MIQSNRHPSLLCSKFKGGFRFLVLLIQHVRDYFLPNPISDFECMNVVDDLPTAHQTIFDHERSLKAEQILGIDHIDHVMNCLDRDDASDDESDHIYEEIMDV